jgi:hypothetical protein
MALHGAEISNRNPPAPMALGKSRLAASGSRHVGSVARYHIRFNKQRNKASSRALKLVSPPL